jgi:hypothetical protein
VQPPYQQQQAAPVAAQQPAAPQEAVVGYLDGKPVTEASATAMRQAGVEVSALPNYVPAG